MRPVSMPWRDERARVLVAMAILGACCAALQGCQPRPVPATGGSQIAETTGSASATSSANGLTGAAVATVASVPAPAPQAGWPKEVGAFASKFGGPVWYPTYLPAGYEADSMDVTKMTSGTGVVLDIVYIGGEQSIAFAQGSPQGRDYQIVSAGEVPWGTETADLIYEDPEDPQSPMMIVYSAPGTLAELYGDAGIDELKAMAASMVRVK